MRGWKTWAAGLGSIGYGIGGLLGGLHGYDEMMKFVVAGMGIIGIGHKIEKKGRE